MIVGNCPLVISLSVKNWGAVVGVVGVVVVVLEVTVAGPTSWYESVSASHTRKIELSFMKVTRSAFSCADWITGSEPPAVTQASFACHQSWSASVEMMEYWGDASGLIGLGGPRGGEGGDCGGWMPQMQLIFVAPHAVE